MNKMGSISNVLISQNCLRHTIPSSLLCVALKADELYNMKLSAVNSYENLQETFHTQYFIGNKKYHSHSYSQIIMLWNIIQVFTL